MSKRPIDPKRSQAPIFWLLFGAGGMLSALVGPALVLITGIAVPLGIVFAPETMSYSRMLALAQNGFGGATIFAVVALFLWHAGHRIFHTLHDLGLARMTLPAMICYGLPLVATVSAGWVLVHI